MSAGEGFRVHEQDPPSSRIPHEVGTVVEGAEGHARIANRRSTPFEAVDHRDHGRDDEPRVPDGLDGAKRRAAGGHCVFDDHDVRAGIETVRAFKHLSGAVLFGRFSDVDRVDRTTLCPRRACHRRSERAASELDACDSGNGSRYVANSSKQRLTHQSVALGQENRRLTVDEKVALLPRAQDEVAATETTFPEKLEQSIHGGVPPRPGRSCNRQLK